MRCFLEVFDVSSGEVRTVLETDRHIEAPNWDHLRDALVVNAEGRLFRVALEGGPLIEVETGLGHLNNDHGLTPDGTRLIVSESVPGRGSVIYDLPANGGAPRQISGVPGAYWHGVSPDGSTLAFCGKREGQFDIYTIPFGGGDEVQLTGCHRFEGHNDGPDYSADGDWIWFNSDRSGHAQIWKMRINGTDVQQVFEDEHVNWFPHPSPDGAWVVYLAYPPGTLQHPPMKEVALCLMRPDGSDRHRILEFTGGQGTINVPSWAPDGSAFAYVRYDAS